MSSEPVNTIPELFLRDVATGRVCDLLDTLIAIRIDVGHSANGVAASPVLGPGQMRDLRALLDSAIASTREVFESVCRAQNADRIDSSADRRVTRRHTAAVDQTPS